jgi:hypothetical protein
MRKSQGRRHQIENKEDGNKYILKSKGKIYRKGPGMPGGLLRISTRRYIAIVLNLRT